MKKVNITHLGQQCVVHVFDSAKSNKVFLVIPDIFESAENYFAFAKYANKKNINVAILSLFKPELSEKAEKAQNKKEKEITPDYFKENVNLMIKTVKALTDKLSLNDIVLLGNGFGANLAVRYLQVAAQEHKAVLCGMGYNNLPHLKFSKQALFLLQTIKLKPHNGAYIKNFIFNKIGKHAGTQNWYSTDEGFVKKLYKQRSFKEVLNFNFYQSFISNILSKEKNMKNIAPKTKILILSGQNDPLIKKENSFELLAKPFEDAALNVTQFKFENMLHCLLNETEKDKVFAKIVAFAK